MLLTPITLPQSTVSPHIFQKPTLVRAKLALIFRLQERIPDIDRAELIAYRVLMFSREEALYWFSRITDFGPDANRWDISGLRLMLGGQPGDAGVGRMLEKLRTG